MAREHLTFVAILLAFIAGIAISSENQSSDVVPSTITTRTDSSRAALSSQDRSAALEKLKRHVIGGRTTRVLFITAKGCSRCEQELNRLRKPGGDFETLQSLGWKIGEADTNHIQIVDRNEFPEMVQLLNVQEFPTVACVSDGEIVRSFKDGCTTPLDVWTFGWLIKGQSERPAGMISEAARVQTTGNYRLRGNHWTVGSDPNPSKEMVLDHLRGPNHGHAAPAYGNLETWSLEELRSLHDDLHEREGGTYGVAVSQPGPIAANRNLAAFSGSRKAFGK